MHVSVLKKTGFILPLVVLEELDGLKKAEGEKGANARRAIRFLRKASNER